MLELDSTPKISSTYPIGLLASNQARAGERVRENAVLVSHARRRVPRA